MNETKWSFFVVIILFSSLYAPAQIRSVTNSDIEKYKQNRLKAKQAYRDNYERWGMPSPEELNRRNEKSRADLEALSAKLRQEEIERSLIESQTRAAQRYSETYYYSSPQYYPYWDSGILSASWLHPVLGRPRVNHGLNGYVGGGQFWPSPGSSSLSAPIRHPGAGWRR